LATSCNKGVWEPLLRLPGRVSRRDDGRCKLCMLEPGVNLRNGGRSSAPLPRWSARVYQQRREVRVGEGLVRTKEDTLRCLARRSRRRLALAGKGRADVPPLFVKGTPVRMTFRATLRRLQPHARAGGAGLNEQFRRRRELFRVRLAPRRPPPLRPGRCS
jgi:hypothetical protein